MAWIQPKTDWKGGDFFNLFTDYFRIKNNLLELKKLLQPVAGNIATPALADYGIDGVGFADFYNNVERGLDALNAAGYADPRIPKGPVWRDNAAAWDAADLNRIEGGIGLLYANALAAKNGRYTLAIRLGKGRR